MNTCIIFLRKDLMSTTFGDLKEVEVVKIQIFIIPPRLKRDSIINNDS